MIRIIEIKENKIFFNTDKNLKNVLIMVLDENFNNSIIHKTNFNEVNNGVTYFIGISNVIVPSLKKPYLKVQNGEHEYKIKFDFPKTDIKNYSIISNSCLGWRVYERFNQPYNSPLIGNLIINDDKFLRMCEHIENYLNSEMTFGDIRPNEDFKNITGSDRAINNNLPNMDNYPVSHHLDIDIHWIHNRRRTLEFNNNGVFTFNENEHNELIPLNEFKEKWYRRLKRSKGTEKICIWSASEMYNLHGNWKRKKLLERFKNIPHRSIFLTERKEEEYEDEYHIIKYLPEWEGRHQLERDKNGGLKWNDQLRNSEIIYNIIREKFL
jgi:uncharacterized protein (DUF1919 family)